MFSGSFSLITQSAWWKGPRVTGSENKREIRTSISGSGVEIRDCLLSGVEIETNHPPEGFSGRCCHRLGQGSGSGTARIWEYRTDADGY